MPSGGDKEAVSSNIDDKTMHEVYLWCAIDSCPLHMRQVLTSDINI